MSCSSFSVPRITLAASLNSRLYTDVLFTKPLPADFVDVALKAGANQVDIRYDTFTKQASETAHAAGLVVMAWFRGPTKMAELGQRDSDFYEGIINCGVDVVCTNEPDKLSDYLSGKGGGGSAEKRGNERAEIVPLLRSSEADEKGSSGSAAKKRKVSPSSTSPSSSSTPTSPSSSSSSSQRRVRFDSQPATVRIIRDLVDRSSDVANIFHCDECSIQFAAGLRGFEMYMTCGDCGLDDDGYDLCVDCHKAGAGNKHEGGGHKFVELDWGEDGEEEERAIEMEDINKNETRKSEK